MKQRIYLDTSVFGGYFDEEFACFNVPQDFTMKPLRIKMTDALIKVYEMDKMLNNI